MKLYQASSSHNSVDSWAQLGDRATAERDVGVGRSMVGFVCRFKTLGRPWRGKVGQQMFCLRIVITSILFSPMRKPVWLLRALHVSCCIE